MSKRTFLPALVWGGACMFYLSFSVWWPGVRVCVSGTRKFVASFQENGESSWRRERSRRINSVKTIRIICDRRIVIWIAVWVTLFEDVISVYINCVKFIEGDICFIRLQTEVKVNGWSIKRALCVRSTDYFVAWDYYCVLLLWYFPQTTDKIKSTIVFSGVVFSMTEVS